MPDLLLTFLIARYSRALTAITISLLLASCQRNNFHNDSHPAYFDKVFLRAEHLKGTTSGNQVPVFLDSAFSRFPLAGTLDLYRKYMFLAEYFVDNKRDFQTALNYGDSALQVPHQPLPPKKHVSEYRNTLFRKGYFLMELKRYTEAFDNYNQARQLAEQARDSCSLSAYTFMLGAVCGLQGNNLEAARYTRKGIRELEHCGESYDRFKLMVSKLDDAGIYYSRHNKPDSALYYFNAALDFGQKHRDKYRAMPNNKQFNELYSAVIYGNMGTAFVKKGDSVTAEKLFLESLRVNTKKEYDQGDAQFTWLKLANLYLAQNRLKEADQMLKEMRFCLDTLPNGANEVSWYRLKFDFLKKSGQPDKVSQYIDAYLKLEDSLSRVKSIPQVDVNKDYENLKNRYELAMLEKQDQVKSLSLVVVIAFSLITISVALLLWYNWKKTKRLHAQVIEHNTEMQHALAALEQSQADNTRMMKIVAHDLRNPIGAIKMAVSLITRNSADMEEDQKILDIITRSANSSLALVSELLNTQPKTEELEKEQVELAAMLQYCVDLLEHKAAAKKQHIKLNTIPVILSGNREKLWRVISNLVANAIKFSPDRSQIVISMIKDDRNVRITVQDNGIGIPDDLRDKVFNMFTDAKRPGTAGEQPFGLGLAISKQIVEAHEGRIWFESEQGSGTTFFVELPL